MDAFDATLGYIRPEKCKLPNGPIACLVRLNEILLDHQLWFLPIPRGFAANQEPALHLLHTRRVKNAIKAFCEQFSIEPKECESFSASLKFMFEKCPSLESMVFRDHDPKVLNAWIYLMVHHKEFFSKIGPKLAQDDDVFVSKVASMAQTTANESGFLNVWTHLLRTKEESTFASLLEECEVTALPEGAIRQNHFIANQCCSDDIHKTLQKQREPLWSLGVESKIANLDRYFWVDPEPVYLDACKTFRVLVYNEEN